MPYLDQSGVGALWSQASNKFGTKLKDTVSGQTHKISLMKTPTTYDSTTGKSTAGADAELSSISITLPTDTHYISKNIVGASATATADAAATNGNVYLNHLENTSVKSSHKITGGGATTVSSNASGAITIASTDKAVSTTAMTEGTIAYLVGSSSSTASTGGLLVQPNVRLSVAVESHTASLLADSFTASEGTNNVIMDATKITIGSGNVGRFTIEQGGITFNNGETITGTEYSGNAATATTADKVANALTLKLNGTSQGAYDGSAAKEINITASSVGAAASSHTHKYAGSSTAGGSATSAVKLDSSAGSSTVPVYFSSGQPVACSGIATQTYVTNAISTAQANAARYQGGITPTSYTALTSAEKGYYWVVTTAGTIAGETCEVGDMVFCNTAFSGVASGAQDATKFDVVQTNITAISTASINSICI